MSAVIPQSVKETPLHALLTQADLKRIHQGKVRDTYSLPGFPDLRLVVATNRLSIFDFVLPVEVPHKGEVLSALTVFWLTTALAHIPHHLVAFGSGLDAYLPEELRGNHDLRTSAVVVRSLSMVSVECIVRGYLTGSGWSSYKKTGEVCGITLVGGLHDGSQIVPSPIFTPTTKAEHGHDVPLDAEAVVADHGPQIRDFPLACYELMARVAELWGLIMADTKLEFGKDASTGRMVLGDEVGTPDSSRFWDKTEWRQAAARGVSPAPFDKQVVRNWGKTVQTPFTDDQGVAIVGLQCLDPENPEHLAFVARVAVPQTVLDETADRYYTVLQRLTSMTLSQFQEALFGV